MEFFQSMMIIRPDNCIAEKCFLKFDMYGKSALDFSMESVIEDNSIGSIRILERTRLALGCVLHSTLSCEFEYIVERGSFLSCYTPFTTPVRKFNYIDIEERYACRRTKRLQWRVNR